MKILFMSAGGDGYPVAGKLAQEGNDVFFWIKEPDFKKVGKGIEPPTIVDKWSNIWKDMDMIVYDMVKQGALADRMQKAGKFVIGDGGIADAIELDRAYGQEMMKVTKASIPNYKEFHNVNEGINFLKKEKFPYVFKPADNQYAAWTFVPKSDTNEGLVSFLQNISKPNIDFILQQKVEGEEISTEGWFNGEKFTTFNHTIEKKRFMEGDRGPQTGCMGNLVWSTEGDKLTSTLLEPLVPFLKQNRYVGPIDVNSIITEKEAWFLEITARFGYDAIQALLALVDKKTEFLSKVGDGKVRKGYSLAVRMIMPPGPHIDKGLDEISGMKVFEIPKQLDDYFWPMDVMKNDKGELVMAGTDGVVGAVVATNETIDGVSEMVYDIIDEIIISKDVQYRGDITSGCKERIEKLTKWGWLDGR